MPWWLMVLKSRVNNAWTWRRIDSPPTGLGFPLDKLFKRAISKEWWSRYEPKTAWNQLENLKKKSGQLTLADKLTCAPSTSTSFDQGKLLPTNYVQQPKRCPLHNFPGYNLNMAHNLPTQGQAATQPTMLKPA
jgi:hypothetical protein